MTPPHLRPIRPLIPHKHHNHNRRRQVTQEEIPHLRGHRHVTVAHRPSPGPELRHENEAVEDEADPTPHHPGLGYKRQLVERVSLDAPGAAEADVSEADGSPSEDRAESREGKHPTQNRVLLIGVSSVGDEAEGRGGADSDHRAALAIYVAEDLGSLSLVSECGEGAVHYRGEDSDASVFDGDDEGAGGTVAAVLVAGEEAGVVVGDEEADEGQADDVEEGDAPEDLLDGCGEGFSRVGGLGGGEADEFGAGEGEGRVDEDGAEALEAVAEWAGVDPEFAADVAGGGSADAVDDDAEEDEADYGDDFDDGEEEFGFSVAFNAE
ncbi:hypothetical protein V499_08117 [Pseudogymnoascus sp. VKM F-103]|nr:hypothetical protein V499_08117 [Pseudogymnoascus sp. VKM F-103]